MSNEQLNQQKQHLQVLQIQMETLAGLESVKKFLELQDKAQLVAKIIQDAEGAAQQSAPEA